MAKSYRDYRNYKQDFVRMLDDVYKKSQSIMYVGDKENANTDSALFAAVFLNDIYRLLRLIDNAIILRIPALLSRQIVHATPFLSCGRRQMPTIYGSGKNIAADCGIFWDSISRRRKCR